MHELLEILSLCLRQERRLEDKALVRVGHVVGAAARPGHLATS